VPSLSSAATNLTRSRSLQHSELWCEAVMNLSRRAPAFAVLALCTRTRVTITRNSAGRRLLAREGRVTVYFTATQQTPGTTGVKVHKRVKLTLKSPRKTHPKAKKH
jgi:hypothetical protein